VAEKGVDVPAE